MQASFQETEFINFTVPLHFRNNHFSSNENAPNRGRDYQTRGRGDYRTG